MNGLRGRIEAYFELERLGTTIRTEWGEPFGDVTTGAPAFLIMMTIPLTFSIANGLALGFLLWVALKTAKGIRLHWLSYGLAALFLARFAYLASPN